MKTQTCQFLFPECKSWVSSDQFPLFLTCSLCMKSVRVLLPNQSFQVK